ncbi:MAG: DNA-directed RNA polymerase subunit beta', partial [candidate division WOR-3 bacterium]
MKHLVAGLQPEVLKAIRIKLASPEAIRSWSYGEVKTAETINYRTQRPEKGGLFCEVIFGPVKDYECACGAFKGKRFAGTVCDKCGVEVTSSSVRRERMGHIELAVPVAHIWFYKIPPSTIALLLDITSNDLESILYYDKYIVIDPGDTPLQKKQILTDKEYEELISEYKDGFLAEMGAPAIKKLLKELDLEELSAELRVKLRTEKTTQMRGKVLKRLQIVDAFINSGNKPEWMILEVLPVIPPDLRPLFPLEGGRYATSDLNDLYRRVINRNNRIKNITKMGAPEIILRNEKRLLQESVDA